jgi:hypothetical protein
MGIQISRPKLSWNTIRDSFSGEWIELVNYQWEWGEATPRWGRVRFHSADRAGLMRQIEAAGEVSDSVVLYVGAIELPMAALEQNVAI